MDNYKMMNIILHVKHNHYGNQKDCNKYIIKTNIKNNIKETGNIYNLSIPKLYIKKATKTKANELPKYSSIKTPFYRVINKSIPNNIDSLENFCSISLLIFNLYL